MDPARKGRPAIRGDGRKVGSPPESHVGVAGGHHASDGVNPIFATIGVVALFPVGAGESQGGGGRSPGAPETERRGKASLRGAPANRGLHRGL